MKKPLLLLFICLLARHGYSLPSLPGSMPSRCVAILSNVDPVKDSSASLSKEDLIILDGLVKRDLPRLLGGRLFTKGAKPSDLRRITYSKHNGDLTATVYFDELIVSGSSNELIKAPDIRFVLSRSAQEFSYSNHQFVIPRIYQIDQSLQNSLLRFLLGHPIHPYLYSKGAIEQRLAIEEPELFGKEVQVELVNVAEKLIKRAKKYETLMARYLNRPPGSYKRWLGKNQRSNNHVQLFRWIIEEHLGHRGTFDSRRKAMSKRMERSVESIEDLEVMEELYSHRLMGVAPTGTGKSEILKGVLIALKKAQHRSQKRVHMVLADSNALMNQLYKELSQDSRFKDQVFIRWGAENGSEPIGKLIGKFGEAKRSGKQVFFLTTTQSFKERMKLLDNGRGKTGQVSPQKVKMLGEHLASITYDEVHHAGASGISNYLKDLLRIENNVFFYGTTATPVHSKVGIIDLFHGNAYWAYLDKPDQFFKVGGQITRKVSDVVEQLYAAINRGELTDFGSIEYEKTEFTKKSSEAKGNGQYEIALTTRNKVVAETMASIANHRSGLITANTIGEANDFLRRYIAFTREKGIDKKFAVLHSKMSNPERHEVFKGLAKDQIDFVITVKMFDEGINVPKMSLFIDLNRSVSPRQMLQRIGRVLRISEGKLKAKVISYGENQSRNAILYREIMDFYQSPNNGKKSLDEYLANRHKKSPEQIEQDKARRLGLRLGQTLESLKSKNPFYKLHWGMVKSRPIFRTLSRSRFGSLEKVEGLREFLTKDQEILLDEILENGDLGVKLHFTPSALQRFGPLAIKLGQALEELKSDNLQYKLHWGLLKRLAIISDLKEINLGRRDKIKQIRELLTENQKSILDEILDNGDLRAQKHFNSSGFQNVADQMSVALMEVAAEVPQGGYHIWNLISQHKIGSWLRQVGMGTIGEVHLYLPLLSPRARGVMNQILKGEEQVIYSKFSKKEMLLANQMVNHLMLLNSKTLNNEKVGLYDITSNRDLAKTARAAGKDLSKPLTYASLVNSISTKAGKILLELVDNIEVEREKQIRIRTAKMKKTMRSKFYKLVADVLLEMGQLTESGQNQGLYDLFTNPMIAERLEARGFDRSNTNRLASDLREEKHKKATAILLELIDDVKDRELSSPILQTQRAHQANFKNTLSLVAKKITAIMGKPAPYRTVGRQIYHLFHREPIGQELLMRGFSFKNLAELASALEQHGYLEEGNFLRTVDFDQSQDLNKSITTPDQNKFQSRIYPTRMDVVKFREFCETLSQTLVESFQAMNTPQNPLLWRHIGKIDIRNGFPMDVKEAVAHKLGIGTFSYLDKKRILKLYGYLSRAAQDVIEVVAFNSNTTVTKQRDFENRVIAIETVIEGLYNSSNGQVVIEAIAKNKTIIETLEKLGKSLDDLFEYFGSQSMTMIEKMIEISQRKKEEERQRLSQVANERKRKEAEEKKRQEQQYTLEEARENVADLLVDKMDENKINSISDCFNDAEIQNLLTKAHINEANFKDVLSELLPRKYRNKLGL